MDLVTAAIAIAMVGTFTCVLFLIIWAIGRIRHRFILHVNARAEKLLEQRLKS